jgi:hypothetical protein
MMDGKRLKINYNLNCNRIMLRCIIDMKLDVMIMCSGLVNNSRNLTSDENLKL